MMRRGGCGRGFSRKRRRGPATTCSRAGCVARECPAACMWIGTASTGAKGWGASPSNWRASPPQTQFGRAMAQLGVELILANSPQAKGRVERMNGVLQDRLVKALRLAGISDLESANRFLEETYLGEFNRRFGRVAASPLDAHRGIPRNLDEVLSWEEPRVVQRDWTVGCEGKWYQLDRQHEALSLAGRKVVVRTLRDGQVQLVYRGRKLKWKQLPKRPARVQPSTPSKPVPAIKPPGANHPWRRPLLRSG